jgi:hypothetical protein
VLQVAIEFGVQATVGDQLLVAAVFGNAAAIEDQHPIRLLNRTQAMSNDQGGAAAQKLVKRLVQGVLRNVGWMTLHPSTSVASRWMKKASSTLLLCPAQLSMLQMPIHPAIDDQILNGDGGLLVS